MEACKSMKEDAERLPTPRRHEEFKGLVKTLQDDWHGVKSIPVEDPEEEDVEGREDEEFSEPELPAFWSWPELHCIKPYLLRRFCEAYHATPHGEFVGTIPDVGSRRGVRFLLF